jgi:hypothetical protein
MFGSPLEGTGVKPYMLVGRERLRSLEEYLVCILGIQENIEID